MNIQMYLLYMCIYTYTYICIYVLMYACIFSRARASLESNVSGRFQYFCTQRFIVGVAADADIYSLRQQPQ